jgi:hypothetical protein
MIVHSWIEVLRSQVIIYIVVGFFFIKKSGGWVLGYRVEHFYFIFIVKKFVKVSVLSLLSLGELDLSLV